MSMKKQTDEKKKKKLTKKLKKIRGVVMMMMVCVLLLSAATYAWFSLSNLARVSNLTMMVSEADGLQVALDENAYTTGTPSTAPTEDKWSGSIDLSDTVIRGVLKPASSTNGKTFKIPVYDAEGKVNELTDTGVVELNKSNKLSTGADTDNNTEGHYYKYTFWMRSLKDAADVRLVHGTNLTQAGRTGTYVVQMDNTVDAALLTAHGRPDAKKTTKAPKNAATAMRISMIPGDVDTNVASKNYAVYEPMADYNILGTGEGHLSESQIAKAGVTDTYTTNEASNVMAVDLLRTQGQDGKFTGTNSTTDGDSGKVFHLEADTATPITLYIWLEGKDVDCVNQIQLDDLKMQLQFEKVKTN